MSRQPTDEIKIGTWEVDNINYLLDTSDNLGLSMDKKHTPGFDQNISISPGGVYKLDNLIMNNEDMGPNIENVITGYNQQHIVIQPDTRERFDEEEERAQGLHIRSESYLKRLNIKLDSNEKPKGPRKVSDLAQKGRIRRLVSKKGPLKDIRLHHGSAFIDYQSICTISPPHKTNIPGPLAIKALPRDTENTNTYAWSRSNMLSSLKRTASNSQMLINKEKGDLDSTLKKDEPKHIVVIPNERSVKYLGDSIHINRGPSDQYNQILAEKRKMDIRLQKIMAVGGLNTRMESKSMAAV